MDRRQNGFQDVDGNKAGVSRYGHFLFSLVRCTAGNALMPGASFSKRRRARQTIYFNAIYQFLSLMIYSSMTVVVDNR